MKPNTYSKLYVHCIFTPKGRNSLLTETIRDKVHKYIYGIIIEKKCFPVAINGTSDHIHILVGFHPTITISDLVRDIKRSSALFINEQIKSYLRFSWQEGYGAFTVGFNELDKIYKYVLNQEDHHKKKSFKNEYIQILENEGIQCRHEFLFEFYD